MLMPLYTLRHTEPYNMGGNRIACSWRVINEWLTVQRLTMQTTIAFNWWRDGCTTAVCWPVPHHCFAGDVRSTWKHRNFESSSALSSYPAQLCRSIRRNPTRLIQLVDNSGPIKTCIFRRGNVIIQSCALCEVLFRNEYPFVCLQSRMWAVFYSN